MKLDFSFTGAVPPALSATVDRYLPARLLQSGTQNWGLPVQGDRLHVYGHKLRVVNRTWVLTDEAEDCLEYLLSVE